MKKHVLTLVLLGSIAAMGHAQIRSIDEQLGNSINDRRFSDKDVSATERAGGQVLWSETFSNGTNGSPGTITTDAGTWQGSLTNGTIWKWSQFGSSGCWSAGNTFPTFTTAANGFLLFDADSANCVNPVPTPPIFNQTVFTGAIESPVIDLTGQQNVVLEFEYQTRWCCTALNISVAFSSDGGSSWSNEIAIPGAAVNIPLEDVFSYNASGLIGGSSQVKVRFKWAGNSHYFLAIDDIRIVVANTDDLIANSAYISHDGSGIEYGGIPQSQLLTSFYIGGEFFNFGSADQTNVVATFDVQDDANNSVFSATANYPSATSGSTYYMDEVAPSSNTLAPGLYEGTLTVESAQEGPGAGTFGNNTYPRNFAVTPGTYAMDGIGVHPVEYTNIGSLGTNSFTGAADGFMMLNYYPIYQGIDILGADVLLTSTTVPGGAIIVSLHDTADVFANDVTLPLAQSDIVDITQAHVNAGMVQVLFDIPFSASPNAYFVSVEMFSNSNSNDIRILDDLSVPQPSWASMVYIPGDQVYSNGNAAAIRLLTDPIVITGVQQNTMTDALSIYPNPSTGLFQVEVQGSVEYRVFDAMGRLVLDGKATDRTTIDLSARSAGVYTLQLLTDSGLTSSKLVKD